MSKLILPGDIEFNDPNYKEGWGNALPPKEARNQKIAQSEGIMTHNHPIPELANTPFSKTAQSTAGVNTIYTNPMWFSPMHTPMSWQVASRRREIYQWSYISSKNPCFLTKYGDFSLEKIEDVYTLMNSRVVDDKTLYIQNAKGQSAKIDIATKRHVKKKANEIKVRGLPIPITVTHDHDCMVIEKKQIKCSLGTSKSKNCLRDLNSPVCQRAKCRKWETIDYEISKKKARDVTKDDYFLVPFPTEVRESVIKTEAQARFAGHLASDGCVAQEGAGVRIFMHSDEVDYVLPCVKETFGDFGFSPGVKTAQHSKYLVTARTGSIAISEFARKLVKGKGVNKKFTEEVMLLDPELQKHVLGAYIQSDGSFRKKSGTIEITTVSPHLANQLMILCFRCNTLAFCGKYNISQSEKTFSTKNKHRYILSIPASYACKLAFYIPGKLRSLLRDEDEENEEFVDTYTALDGDMDRVNQLIPPKKRKTQNKRFFWKNYVVSPVISNTSFDYEGDVYDVRAPEDFTVTANGVAIHQCRFFYSSEPKVGAGIDFYCFEPSMQVLMSDGTQKAISSIRPGDLVRSHDGSTNEVGKIFEREIDEIMLKIKIAGISNESNLRVTSGHELYTERNGSIQKVKADELNPGDYLLTPACYENGDDKVSDDFAWLIGIYSAEGYPIPYESKNRKWASPYKGVYFRVSATEFDTLAQRIKNTIYHLYGSNRVSVRLFEEDNSVLISVYGAGIADDLIGSCPGMAKKGGTKRLSPRVLKWNKSNLRYLLAGFLDGDGCFNKNNGFQGVGVSKKLCEQIANICDILGIEYSFTSTRSSNTNRQVVYNIRISRRACKCLSEICGKIYDYEVDESKILNTPYFKKDNYIYRKIITIKPYRYSGKVYDLEIKNVHSYVVNRIAVSNSQFPVNGLKLVWPHGKGERKALKFFEREVKRLDLVNILRQISSEFYMLGDVFIHTEISCPRCFGRPLNPVTGEMCNHPGGTISRLNILNPDWIEVTDTIFADLKQIVLVPDEQIVRLVSSRQPRAIYDRLSDQVKRLVLAKKPIPLSERVVSHLKHMACGYGTYGTSLIRRLFTTLAYKTKIMTANWIVAERLIIPIRIVKIGSDNRPATSADISEMQQMLATSASDPNVTIVTHHNIDYDWVGACHDERTEVLTVSGFRKYGSFDPEEEILTYNVHTKRLEYQKPQAFHEFDYDGEMICFNSKNYDICVTPNHKMLQRAKGGWKVIRADEMGHNGLRRFVGTAQIAKNSCCYDPVYIKSRQLQLVTAGNFSNEEYASEYCVTIGDKEIDLDLFLKFAGYYISEGTLQCKKPNYHIGIYQSSKPKTSFGKTDVLINIENCLSELPWYFGKYSYRENEINYVTSNKQLVLFMLEQFGHGAANKSIPLWIKNLPVRHIEILIASLVEGDGHNRKTKNTKCFSYKSISEQLIDDLQQIAYKCGYAVKKRICSTHPSSFGKRQCYELNISKGYLSNGREPCVRSRHVSRIPYKGKVWCFTVPNGFFVTRRNGKITIQGNSGKILQLSQELEHIDKEMLDGLMLNQALLNGEMCLTEDHEVLTGDGFKPISEFKDTDILCVWDDETRSYSYETPKHFFKYDDVEEVFEIHSRNKVLFKCTDAHKIVLQKTTPVMFGPYSIKPCTAKLHIAVTAQELFEKGCYDVYTLMHDGNYCQITEVKKVPYKNTVYCFETSTGYFVARHKDFEFVSSNSGYQSAQVGVEVLIRRLEAWRTTLANWIEERVLKPIAQMKNLVDEESSKEMGEKVWLYPVVKWNDLNLKDKTQWYQLLMQLHDKQVISTQTLCEELDLQYDQEVERLRYEISQAGPMGAALGGQGMGGGGLLGGGGLGGMPGGGISAPGGGAAAPPMEGGPGGVPGGVPGGGGMPGGGAPGGGAMASMSERPMKILKKSKAKALQEQQEPMQFGQVKFTSIEQEFRRMLDTAVNTLNLQTPYFFQYKIEKTAGGPPYVVDFAFPKLKLGLELDGSVWHSNPKQVQHDRQRDNELAMKGWTIVRFDDKTMEEQPDAVRNTTVAYLKRITSREQSFKKSMKDSDGETCYKTVYAGKIIDLYSDELPKELIELTSVEGEQEC